MAPVVSWNEIAGEGCLCFWEEQTGLQESGIELPQVMSK